MADQSLQILVEMIAKGDGGKLTIEEIKKITAEIARLETEIKKVEKAGGSVGAGVDARLDLLKGSLAKAGALDLLNEGEKSADSWFNGLDSRMRRHIGAMAGRFAGIPGLGLALGGTAAVSAGFVAATVVLDQLLDKYKQYKEEMQGVADLSATLHSTGQFSKEYLNELSDTAEHLSTNAVKTKEWLEVLKELHQHGANADNIRPMLQTLEGYKNSASEAKQLTKAWTEALDGNYKGFQALGVVVDDNVSQQQKLAQAAHQTQLQIAGIVKYGPQVIAFKEAGERAAEGLKAIAREADETAHALDRALTKLEALKNREHAAAKGAEGVDKAQVEKDFAEGKITAAQKEEKLAEISKRTGEAQFNADKKNLEGRKQIARETAAAAQKEIDDRRALGDALVEQWQRSVDAEDKQLEAQKKRAAATAAYQTQHPRGYVAPGGMPLAEAAAAEKAAEDARNKAFGKSASDAQKEVDDFFGKGDKEMREPNDKARAKIKKANEELSDLGDAEAALEKQHHTEMARIHLTEQTKRLELIQKLQKSIEEFHKQENQSLHQHGKPPSVPDDLKPFMDKSGKFVLPSKIPDLPADSFPGTPRDIHGRPVRNPVEPPEKAADDNRPLPRKPAPLVAHSQQEQVDLDRAHHDAAANRAAAQTEAKARQIAAVLTKNGEKMQAALEIILQAVQANEKIADKTAADVRSGLR